MICDVCGHALERRSDEDPEVARVRLETYIRQTKPVVEHYRALGSLVEIDGSKPMAEVEADVDAAVSLRGKT
jgi:adenylate kinase